MEGLRVAGLLPDDCCGLGASGADAGLDTTGTDSFTFGAAVGATAVSVDVAVVRGGRGTDVF